MSNPAEMSTIDGNIECRVGTSVPLDVEMEEVTTQVERSPSGVDYKDIEKGIEAAIYKVLKRIEEEKKTPEDTSTWSKVLGKKKGKKKIPQEEPTKDKGADTRKNETVTEKRKTKPFKALEKRRARGAGVILELQGGGPDDYAEVIKQCEKNISLEEMGIPSLGIRKTRGGGMLLEVRGDGDEEKAEHLAEKIKEIIKSRRGAKIWRPSRLQRIRMTGLPFGVSAEEIAAVVAEAGNGEPGKIRVGPRRTNVFGADAAWVDCPTSVALRVARVAETDGLKFGWARVGVSLMEREAPRCFRCLARGHLGRWCPSEIDRGRCCLGCGEIGHTIGGCKNKPRCPVCVERGLRADHRPGDPSQCRPVPPGAARCSAPRGGPPPLPILEKDREGW